MKLSSKAVFYIVTIIVSGAISLLFNKILIIRGISFLIMLIVAILIYFDKKYRNKYIPSMPNWFLLGIIIIVLALYVYSFFI
jgi:hypothetical protein